MILKSEPHVLPLVTVDLTERRDLYKSIVFWERFRCSSKVTVFHISHSAILSFFFRSVPITLYIQKQKPQFNGVLHIGDIPRNLVRFFRRARVHRRTCSFLIKAKHSICSAKTPGTDATIIPGLFRTKLRTMR